MSFLRNALVSAVHRLGLFTYLRRSWLADVAKEGERRSALERLVGRVQRTTDAVEQALPGRIDALEKQVKKQQRELRTLRALITIDQAQRGRWNELEATLDADGIRTRLDRVLASTPIEDVPMPLLVLRNFLPAATYDALLEAIPPDEFFPDKDPIKQNLKLQQLDFAPAWTRRALGFLEATIIDDILAPAIVARMQPYLEEIYRDEYGPEISPRVAALRHAPTAGRLMLRRPGYKLEPHLDPHRVAITCLIYFARPGDDSSYGTELYAVDRPVTLDRSNTFYPRQHGYDCQFVRAVPFEPNTALVFLNRGGAHAAQIPANAPRDTKRFAYQFYISPDQAALDAVVARDADDAQAEACALQ